MFALDDPEVARRRAREREVIEALTVAQSKQRRGWSRVRWARESGAACLCLLLPLTAILVFVLTA